MTAPNPKPVWLVTGCSTGFGRELAKILIGRGYRVVATARDPARLADLVHGHDASAIALKLDVDKAADVAAVVEAGFIRLEEAAHDAARIIVVAR